MTCTAMPLLVPACSVTVCKSSTFPLTSPLLLLTWTISCSSSAFSQYEDSSGSPIQCQIVLCLHDILSSGLPGFDPALYRLSHLVSALIRSSPSVPDHDFRLCPASFLVACWFPALAKLQEVPAKTPVGFFSLKSVIPSQLTRYALEYRQVFVLADQFLCLMPACWYHS